MTTQSEITAMRPQVAAKRALVLAEPEVWAPSLTGALEGLGLDVRVCSELQELFDAARQQSVALVVLAPHNTVFAVRACRVIRELQNVAIMAVIQREGDLIPVLDAGADDAVIARADPAVFAARVRALMRRTNPAARAGESLVIRDLVIDLEKYQVSMRGEPVALTPTEFRLLAVLAQHAGRVVDPRALLSAVHQHDYSERDAQNLVKVHIANLRRKLNDQRTANPYILCVRGFGYMLERRSHQRDDDPLAKLIDEE
jgi:DNA-binding response OmpR family regulator